MRPLMPILREVIAMSAFVNILALAVPVFTLQVYDRVVFQAGIGTLYGLVIGMFFVVIFDYVLRQSRSRIMQTVALRIDVDVGRRLFDKVLSLPLQTLESAPTAHWTALFRDVDTVRNTLSGASAILIADLPFAFLFLGLIFAIALPVAWVLLIILPLFMLVAWRSAAAMSSANQDEQQTAQSRDSLISEMIQGRSTIKALALDNSMRPLWENAHAENIEKAITRGGKSDGYSNLGATLTMVTSVTLTTVGALAIIDQRLTMGALIATNMLSGRILGPMNQLVGQWRTFTSFVQSVDRLGNLFASPSERTESEIQLDRPSGEIRVENVSFSYSEDGPPIVNNVEFDIKPNQIMAMVGRNGSGKTTLLKLVQGLYKPSSGRVLLDGADMAQFTRKELSHWLGYVPQDCILFTGTIHDNICQRVPDASDEEVLAAAKASGVHQFIIDMPDGYATDIGEAGQRLSGGQRQRIAIARALVGNPPVLLLDEPSSSLDRQAEQELRRTLKELSREHTIIIVTHSPILLAVCDEMIALDKGRIALSGPASDILPRLFGKAGPATSKEGPAGAPARPAAPTAEQAPAPARQPERRAQAQPAAANAGAADHGQPARPAPAQAQPEPRSHAADVAKTVRRVVRSSAARDAKPGAGAGAAAQKPRVEPQK